MEPRGCLPIQSRALRWYVRACGEQVALAGLKGALMTGTTPPGWYPNPNDPSTQRWWDGGRWTEHVAPAPQQAPGPQAPQYATHPSPHPAGYPMVHPRKRRSAAGWIVAVALLLVGVVAVAPFLVRNAFSGAVGDGDYTVPTVGPNDAPVFYIADRPDFADMAAFVDGLYETYSQQLENGSIYEYVDNSDAGTNYAQTFVYALLDVQQANSWNVSSTNAAELDDTIAGRRHRAAEFERRFLLGEDLGFSISVTGSDGATNHYTGVPPTPPATIEPPATPVPSPEPPPAEQPTQAPEPVDPEEYARQYVPVVGEDGTYRTAAYELTQAFGMEYTFEFDYLFDYCAWTPETEQSQGAFCTATPHWVYVNLEAFPDIASNPSFDDVIRHELAHRRIFDFCGTLSPPIAGTAWEGVTNAYAVAYLGANADELLQDGPYLITDEAMAIAEAIHGGTCQ